jgi:hypothetical protein
MIFDKSALESLSLDESVWLEAFFRANVVPVFYVETLADLEKQVEQGKTPEAVVGRLAEKTPANALPNWHHRVPLLGELAGDTIPMTGQALIEAPDLKQAPDGSVGVHFEESPEAAARLRWQDHEFLEVERQVARQWRSELAVQELDPVVGALSNIVPPSTKISDLAQLKVFIDDFCSLDSPEVIRLAFDVLAVPDGHRRVALERWEAAARPPLDQFAPYCAHVFKVDLLFYLGVDRSFIAGQRASNRVDIAYIYYLPFAKVFASKDNLHRRTVPLFLREDQSYLDGHELKQALHELDEHYDRLPDEIKQLGVLSFASWPPADLDNVVTRLWDKHMRPDWRDLAREHEKNIGRPVDTAAGRETVAEINRKLDGARVVPGDAVLLGDPRPDYFAISYRIPAKKGKWRLVSKEVEDADER